MVGRLGQPRGIPNGVGVLVLPGVSGIDAVIDRVLTDLAGAGFCAVAWDPFQSYDPAMDLKEKARIAYTVQLDADVLEQHSAWARHIDQALGLRRIAVLGFCMGGRMALLLAAQDSRIGAAVAFYPTLRDPKPAVVIDPVPLMAQVRCPVQLHYPGKDAATSRANFNALRTALEARSSGLTSVFFHPAASHAFLSRAGESDHPDGAASALSWPAALSFLATAPGDFSPAATA
jgi:carboxymethylenebutenolidase